MRGRTLAAAVLLTVFLAGTIYAQNTYYLSQVATGRFNEGSYRTTFVLFGHSDNDATVLLELADNDGNPLLVTIGGLGTHSQFTIQLPAGSSRVLQTDGQGSLAVGGAKVTSTTGIGVSAIFTLFDTGGNYVTESGVGSSEPLTSFVLPVDTTGLFNTGIALMGTGAGDANITMTLRGTTGSVAATRTDTLTQNGHKAGFVSGQGQMFPSISNFRGTLLIESSVPIAALVLRQNERPLSFTSLPVVSTTSTKTNLNLPQVANGTYADGSYKTSFLLFSVSSTPANVTMSLTRTVNGTPFPLTIQGQGTNSTFNITLAPGASIFLQTDGLGSLAAGAAAITSSAPIGASAIFSVFDNQGSFRTESGVGDSAVLTSLTLPVDVTGGFDTGVAFFSPSGANLSFRLLDSNGNVAASNVTRTLSGNGHFAEFATQIFPGTSNFRGTLAVSSTSGVAALTLRQNLTPLSYTTLPVTSGTATGKTAAAPLLSQTVTGIDATSSVTLNRTLQAGFKIAGTFSGSGTPAQVIASSGQNLYAGIVDVVTRRYTILVPAGSYDLKASFEPGGVPAGGSLIVTFAVPGTVQVSADTTRDIALPSVTLFNISGTVSGWATLPSATAPLIDFASNDNLFQGEFTLGGDGSFQAALPASSYRASIGATIGFSLFASESLSLFNVGSLNVTGNAAGANFTVSATARLTGSVSGPGLPGGLAFGAGVVANDISVPAPTEAVFVFPPTTSSADLDLTNQYQMILMRNRTYQVDLTLPLVQGATPIGLVTVPVPEAVVNLSGDATFNFTIPSLPATVTLSGRVTDAGGRGVGGASISAYTQSLTGVSGMGFMAFALTDADGNYSFQVLSGANYQIIIAPPLQAP